MERPSVVAGGGRRGQRARTRYVLVLVAAALFGINGSAAKVALSSGLSSLYLGVLLVAVWARTFRHELVHRRVRLALGLALAGLAPMVELWRGTALDGVGILFAPVVFAVYLLTAEREAAPPRPRLAAGLGISLRHGLLDGRRWSSSWAPASPRGYPPRPDGPVGDPPKGVQTASGPAAKLAACYGETIFACSS